jgi:hypothetical protein
MSVVNVSAGFVYLANPHTASRATTTALLALPGSEEVAHHHANLAVTIEACPNASKCSTVFQTVRDPLDWLVSRFLCNGGFRGEWKDWVKKYPPPIFRKFIGEATCYAKYENLKDDLQRLTGHKVTLRREQEHKTPGKPRNHLDYWTDEMIAWAKKRFATDFEAYNYG